MRQRYRNPDRDTRSLERAFLQGDISAREPLIAALARENNWRRIFEILPKINPIIFKEQGQGSIFPCGCDTPIPGREIEAPQGRGLLSTCNCGHYYAFLVNANSMIEAYESGIDQLYSFKFYEGPVGYYIGGLQYTCSGVTIGPHFCPHPPRILNNGWIEVELWFHPGMVHPTDVIEGPNEEGRVLVVARINPDDLDWWLLLRGISS